MKRMTDYPLASVVIPCRNELDYIGVCLDSLLANDYPKDKMEILVIDGMSHDGTRNIVESYSRRYPFIKLLDNPKCITPVAMNIGIQSSNGEVIAIVGSHATYGEHYLSECVKNLYEYGADDVGAVAQYIPRENDLISKAIAIVLAHPFGAGANILYKAGVKNPTWVDTVSSGCYRRDVFDRIGYFNERLIHSQDYEFNLRLRKAGGKILLVPSAIIHYFVRSDIKSFCKHNFRNGLWVILPFIHSSIFPVSWRHLIPLVFVSGLIFSVLLAAVLSLGLLFLTSICGIYLFACLTASMHVTIRKRDLRYFPIMPLVFGMLHIGYGLGSFCGVMKVLVSPRLWKRIFKFENQLETDSI